MASDERCGDARKQVHIIKDELGKLVKEFGRFDERMKKLADHIRQAPEDAQDVRTTSQKLTQRFTSIEQVELNNIVSSDFLKILRLVAL